MEWIYEGKFVDRTPHIRAAGAPLKHSDKLSECLKVYPVEDAIETVLTEAGLHKVPLEIPPERLNNSRHIGIYTEARAVINPPVDTRYQTLLKDLQETTWKSYWNKQLGTVKDPIGYLPPKIQQNQEHTFGITMPTDNPTGEQLLNPDITPYEIVFNDAEHHEMYKTTHKDYFPGEQVNRDYGLPFDPRQRYGSIPRRMASAACSMKMLEDQPVEMASDILSDHIDGTHFQLGKALMPNKNIKCVETGHRFGKKSLREYHTLADLIQPQKNNTVFRKDFYAWLSALIEVRSLFRKRNTNFRELYGYCKYVDINDAEWLDFDVFVRILFDKHLLFPVNEIVPLAACLGIYNNGGLVHYGKMLDLLDLNVDIPDISRFEDENTEPLMTTTQYERCMAPYKDNSKMLAAGIGQLKPAQLADIENLGNETTAAVLVNPCIFTNYGLSHIDLLAPRKAEYLRKLFERLGYEFPDDTFDKLLDIGKELEKRDDVSVDAFRQIIEQAAPITIKEEPDDPCFTKGIPKQCP